MSDLRALKEMLPSFDGFYGSPLRENDEEADGADMERDENQLFASPYVYGFSFYAKTWGEMVFAQMKPIAFRKDAFEKLVLDDESKRLVDALVRQTISGEPGSGDLIDGKGGGAIFLLHGSPGVGKTLTAEAIAERQERPLYMVGAGELGVSPEELEERLQKILEVAFAWRAVLLIDEADIFMERRSRDDVTRNAMVGIFLRLLEYHQGILFLTTNRVEDIDSAFLSRISIGLRYAPHEEEARAQIWKNLLEGNKALGSLDGRAAGKLARHNINGRQIKHCIRLACALAAAEQRPAQIEDLEMMVSIAEKFRKDFQAGQKESANG